MCSCRILIGFKFIKPVPIAFGEYNLSKHVPVAKYWFVLFWIPWRISEIVWFYMLVFIRGSKVSKRAEINQDIAFYVMEQKVIVETTFQSLYVWLQFQHVKTWRRRVLKNWCWYGRIDKDSLQLYNSDIHLFSSHVKYKSRQSNFLYCGHQTSFFF